MGEQNLIDKEIVTRQKRCLILVAVVWFIMTTTAIIFGGSMMVFIAVLLSILLGMEMVRTGQVIDKHKGD
jgi:hypothetical protein